MTLSVLLFVWRTYHSNCLKPEPPGSSRAATVRRHCRQQTRPRGVVGMRLVALFQEELSICYLHSFWHLECEWSVTRSRSKCKCRRFGQREKDGFDIRIRQNVLAQVLWGGFISSQNSKFFLFVHSIWQGNIVQVLFVDTYEIDWHVELWRGLAPKVKCTANGAQSFNARKKKENLNKKTTKSTSQVIGLGFGSLLLALT